MRTANPDETESVALNLPHTLNRGRTEYDIELIRIDLGACLKSKFGLDAPTHDGRR